MHPSPQIIGLFTQSPLDISIPLEDFRHCQIIEVRFDLFPEVLDKMDAVIAKLRELFPHQALMATIRLQRDGGYWPNDDAMGRAALFKRIIMSEEFDWVDFEYEEPNLLSLAPDCVEHQVQILVSHHNFQASYNHSELEALTQEIEVSGASAAKFALTFQSPEDEVELYQFLQNRSDYFVFAAFSMGELGQASRVVAPLLGASGTYGYTGKTPSAPGQWSLNQLAEFFSQHPSASTLSEAQGAAIQFLN